MRWCGKERGESRRAEWSVVLSELCNISEIQTPPSPIAGDLSWMDHNEQDIGELHNIIQSKGLVFACSETDLSIRPGWFYQANEEPYSIERLFNTYLRSCGANTTFNLNIPLESFVIFNDSGNRIYSGFTVGHRKICPVDAECEKMTLFVTSARDEVIMRDISVYGE